MFSFLQKTEYYSGDKKNEKLKQIKRYKTYKKNYVNVFHVNFVIARRYGTA